MFDLFSDVFSAVLQLMGTYTETCQNIEKGYHHLFGKYPNKYCLAYAHSKGVLINSRVFRRLPSQYRRRIFSFNFGGANVIPPKGLAGSMNYASSHDFIPKLTSPWEMMCHAFSEQDHIQVLDGKGFWGTDHSFSNDTYQKQLQRSARYIENKFGN